MTIEQRLERLEKQAGITDEAKHEWPPAGVAIEMWCDGDLASDAVIRVSAGGGGNYYVIGNGDEGLIKTYDNWRYHVPPWPKWAESFVVFEDGTTRFSMAGCWVVLEKMRMTKDIDVAIVAVIQREDRE